MSSAPMMIPPDDGRNLTYDEGYRRSLIDAGGGGAEAAQPTLKMGYVYYWNNDSLSFDGFKADHELVIAYQGEIEVIEGRCQETINAALELLFQIFNDDYRRPADYRGPSMSVGSVVHLDEVGYYQCDRVGWLEVVNGLRGKVSLAPKAWIRAEKTEQGA